MGILEQVEKLQKKPRSFREKILVLSVLAIMALIVALWVQTVRHSFAARGAESGATNPMGALWNTARDGFKDAFKNFNF